MQLDRVQPEARGAACGIDELALDLGETCHVERSRRRFVGELGNRRGCDGRPPALIGGNQLSALPRHLRRALPARVRQLDRHRHRRRIRPHDRQTLADGLFAGIVVKTQASVRDAADRRNRGRLDREHAGARFQELAPMHDVPVGGAAIHGGVLAHRRHDDAVRQRELAELEGREEVGFGHGDGEAAVAADLLRLMTRTTSASFSAGRSRRADSAPRQWPAFRPA